MKYLLILFSAGLAIASGETRFPNGTINYGSGSVGTSSPAASSIALDVVSTTKGFAPPRMTTTQRNAISSPATGLIVYDTSLSSLYLYNGASWIPVSSASGVTGDIQYNSSGSLAGTNSLFWDNSNTRLGIGTSTPSATLNVIGNATISGTAGASNLSGTNTGDITLAAVGSSPSANGASLSGQALTLQPFDATHPGVLIASGGGTTTYPRADGTWASPVPSPSPSSIMMDIGGAWTPVPFPSPSPSGQFVMANGTGFVLSAAGGGTPSGVSGNVQYNSSGSLGGSNNLFWDIANSRLGVGTSTPSVALDVNGAVRDRNLSTAGIVSTDSSGNLASASNASTFTTLYETIATTLGDLVYGGASGAPTRLAGNTQNSAYVLTSQASGGVATAPSWQPVSAIGISTDWATYTPTFAGLGTVSGATAQWRRVGDTLEVHGTVVSGTSTSGGISISFPSGLSLDTTKASTANAVQLGSANRIISGGVHPNLGQGPWILFYDGSDATVLFVSASTTQSDGANTYTKQHADQVIGSGQLLSFNFVVPISSWSSNTIGASQGAVYVHYFGSNASNAPGAGLPLNFDSKIDDSGCLTGSCIVTTGASWKATAPVTGTYNGSILVNYSSGTAGNIKVYKNGSFYEYLGEFNTGVSFVPMPFSLNLNAGDYIDMRPDTGASFNGGAAPYQMLFSMSLQSGNGAGNVSSSTTGSEHIERAHVTNNGSVCAITSQSGTWLSVNTRVGTGECKWNIAAGEFSAAPACTYTLDNQSGAMVALPAAANTNVLLDIVTVNTSRAVADYNYDMICMGPK